MEVAAYRPRVVKDLFTLRNSFASETQNKNQLNSLKNIISVNVGVGGRYREMWWPLMWAHKKSSAGREFSSNGLNFMQIFFMIFRRLTGINATKIFDSFIILTTTKGWIYTPPSLQR